MSSWKGALLGACTVICVAAGVALEDLGHSWRTVLETYVACCFIGMLPGVAAGAAVGRLAERGSGLLALAGCAVGIAVVTCVLTLPGALAYALPAACMLAFVAERGARRPERALSIAWRGAIVGAANVGAVAIAAGMWLALGRGVRDYDLIWRHAPPGLITLAVGCIGLLPGLLGGQLGAAVVSRLGTAPAAIRVALLTALGIAIELGLARLTGSMELMPVAVVPTLASAIALERWTRTTPAVPAARVV